MLYGYRGCVLYRWEGLVVSYSIGQSVAISNGIITGRTFPSYPYFSQATKVGQESLERLLHAYAVKDCEVGYCQGLSFVAGVILIHVSICV